MVEAVGWQYLDTFFRRCSELLVPDGLMLLQAITMDDRAFEVEKATRSFMKTVIFPGCCLPSVEVIRGCVDRSTDMRALDIEDIGDHYPETLQRWRDLFLANEPRIAELGYDRRFRRIWHFYLAWCQAGFIERRTSDAQVLLAKPAYRRSSKPVQREARLPEAMASH
jgi:cyclopropane-fatty-acyl-phospholipid synthase